MDLEELISTSVKVIPSVDEIISKALKRCNFTQEVEENFSSSVETLERVANSIYDEYENKCLETFAQGWIKQRGLDNREEIKKILNHENYIEKLKNEFIEFVKAIQNLEKHLGNMRKARGGKSFEKIISILLGIVGIPYEIPRGEYRDRLRRIDIVIPSSQQAINYPDKAVFLTCKRTLRERWKQEVPQVGPNQTVYLITIDDDISQGKAKEIHQMGLIAFTKDSVAHNINKPWIRGLSDLPKDIRQKIGMTKR